MPAKMGQHQLTIRDHLRHSNLHVTNKYFEATSKAKRLAQDKWVDAALPTGMLPTPKLIRRRWFGSEFAAWNSHFALIVP